MCKDQLEIFRDDFIESFEKEIQKDSIKRAEFLKQLSISVRNSYQNYNDHDKSNSENEL